ncbi:zinc finger protein 705F-like isoform X3 [Halichoerus grypus]
MESSLQEGSLWGHPSEEQSQEPLTILSALISSKEQESVTFKDVAIDLTQEEWTLMDRSQRKMYIDVMLENITHLVSVGCQFFQSDVISQWEQGGVLWREDRGLAQGWSPGLENSHKKEETISMQDIFKEDPSNYNTIPPIRPMLVDTPKGTWTLDPLTTRPLPPHSQGTLRKSLL